MGEIASPYHPYEITEEHAVSEGHDCEEDEMCRYPDLVLGQYNCRQIAPGVKQDFIDVCDDDRDLFSVC